MQGFKDLLDFYEELDRSVNRLKKLLADALKSEKYRDVSIMDGDFTTAKITRNRIGKILKDNFREDINKEIEITQKLYEKEHDYAVGAWQMYGSELAGDFNSGEVKAQKKLNLLKEILK